MTPTVMMADAAALLNDTAASVFTPTVLLPFYNMAIQELQEIFELNNVPVTNEVSSTLNVLTGTTVIGFATTPALPSDLIDIRQLWESPEGQDAWSPLIKKDFLPHYIDGEVISQFLVFSWIDQEIRLPEANTDIDLKIDYVKSILSRIAIGAIGTDIPILNVQGFLTNRMAAFAANFIGENKTRSDELNAYAILSLERSLGINTKGRQSISTRRRPFRAAYKQRSIY